MPESLALLYMPVTLHHAFLEGQRVTSWRTAAPNSCSGSSFGSIRAGSKTTSTSSSHRWISRLTARRDYAARSRFGKRSDIQDMSAGGPDWAQRYDQIYRFVRRRSSSREEAEDVTQEVFADAARALAEARSNVEAPTLAWLYTVARRRLIDKLRREGRQLLQTDAAVSAAAEERNYGPSITGPVLDGLRELEEQQRQVVVLKLFDGRPFAEIAALVGATSP